MSIKKFDINIIFMHLAGGMIGFLAALIALHLIHTIANGDEHSFIYHWLKEQSPLYAFAIIASFSLTGVLAIGQYVNKKELRYELRKNKELDEASQAKTEAISFASHELRTPLTAVKWGIKSLLEEDFGQISPEQKKVLEDVYQTNENMQTLLADFLDSSKIDIGKLEISLKNISLTEMERAIKQLAAKKQPLAKKKKIELKYDAAVNYPSHALVDLNRISQVVDNLLENAINYTPAGGAIKVSLSSNKNDFKFSITDSGIGIPAKEQAKVFVKFFRATNARKLRSGGTGLGLYLCKRLIDGHQGGVWVESAGAGRGSRFCFTLPIRARQETEELFRKI
ncbi:MAG: HAMP domain-containing sensor histidine kinase [bacterium]|nr:HAMP domain-containing sensor histidine kinase [bacterium]